MNYGNKVFKAPKDIEKLEILISNIANVVKDAKEGETIMCNVDIEDCLVKGKIGINNIEIDEGVLGVLELIKREAKKKRINFIMNFNSVADFNNLYVKNKDLLQRLYDLNQDNTINRITIDDSKVVSDGAKNQHDKCPAVMEKFIFARPSDDDDDYENEKPNINYNNGILTDGKLKKI